MLHVISTLVLGLIVLGVYNRAHPRVHIAIMSCALATDLALLLYIEFSRHAVEKVMSHVRPTVYLHVGVSLCVLICYAVMIILGRRVLKGHRASRATHRTMGITFVVLRSLNYVTALTM